MVRTASNHLFLLLSTPTLASYGYLVVEVREKIVMVIGIGFNFGVEATYHILYCLPIFQEHSEDFY